MRILIVGAGAVGQVYAHHLARADAEVGLYVRPRRRAEAGAGYTLTQIHMFGRRTTSRFVPSFVATSPADALRRDVDQVWLCVPTTALDDAMLADIGAAAPRATFVVLAPGHFVKARVDAILGAKRTVYGVIGMVSYHAPLVGSEQPRELETPAGTAYFLSTTKLAGDNGRRTLAAITLLRDGGVPCEPLRHPEAEIAYGTGALMPNIAALELAGWSFARFAAELSPLAARATRESLRVNAAVIGAEPPAFAALVQPALLAFGARLAPRFTPLDIERFLEVHFKKVGDQTRLLLNRTVADGARLGVETPALSELCARLSEPLSPADGGAAASR